MTPDNAMQWSGIMTGAFLAFYAYVGFEDMVNVAEEVRDVERNLPRAILISIGIATILYVSISSLALLVMPTSELGASTAPLADMYTRITGEAPYLISAISVFAVINGALIQIIMGSRVFYGMSRQKWMPAWMSVINNRTRTPVNATVVVIVLIMIVVLALPIETLAKTTSFFLLTIFALVNASLVMIKLRAIVRHEAFRIPLVVPVLGLLCCVGLLLVTVRSW